MMMPQHASGTVPVKSRTTGTSRSHLSCLVLRLWQPRQSQSRFSGVNARSIAAGPSARATSIASLWSISSDGSPHISQSVCCISSGCCPDATAMMY